jgi:hypothetical protein
VDGQPGQGLGGPHREKHVQHLAVDCLIRESGWSMPAGAGACPGSRA